MGCGCFSCGECVKFLSGSPGKSGSGSVDDFPDTFPVRKCTSSQYYDLEQKLMDLPLYQPLFLNGIASLYHLERGQWLSRTSLPFPIMLYKYAYGNNVGTLVYAWRIP